MENPVRSPAHEELEEEGELPQIPKRYGSPIENATAQPRFKVPRTGSQWAATLPDPVPAPHSQATNGYHRPYGAGRGDGGGGGRGDGGGRGEIDHSRYHFKCARNHPFSLLQLISRLSEPP